MYRRMNWKVNSSLQEIIFNSLFVIRGKTLYTESYIAFGTIGSWEKAFFSKVFAVTALQ